MMEILYLSSPTCEKRYWTLRKKRLVRESPLGEGIRFSRENTGGNVRRIPERVKKQKFPEARVITIQAKKATMSEGRGGGEGRCERFISLISKPPLIFSLSPLPISDHLCKADEWEKKEKRRGFLRKFSLTFSLTPAAEKKPRSCDFDSRTDC